MATVVDEPQCKAPRIDFRDSDDQAYTRHTQEWRHALRFHSKTGTGPFKQSAMRRNSIYRLPSLVLPMWLITSCHPYSPRSSAIESARDFHNEMSQYLSVHSMVWPQCPFDPTTDPAKFTVWWEAQLAPFSKRSSPLFHKDYTLIPQHFSKTPAESYRYSRPWLQAIPKGGGSPLFVLRNGEVRP